MEQSTQAMYLRFLSLSLQYLTRKCEINICKAHSRTIPRERGLLEKHHGMEQSSAKGFCSSSLLHVIKEHNPALILLLEEVGLMKRYDIAPPNCFLLKWIKSCHTLPTASLALFSGMKTSNDTTVHHRKVA